MPRYRDGFPRPKKEYHHGVWRIIWRWDGKKYSVATSIADKEAISEIEAHVRTFASLLASKERPHGSSPLLSMTGMERYFTDRFGPAPSSGQKSVPSSDKWIADYAKEIKGECSEKWAELSITRLRALDAETSGLAVPLAFYSGMRREEIANLEWPDVRFAERKIVVRRTKTKKGRTIPLNAKLESLLSSRPAAERSGYVVKIADAIDRLLRLDNLVRNIQKAKQKELMKAWDITQPAPSRSKDYPTKKKEFEAAKKKRASVLKTTLGRIGWNSFRHTFGSLLAQSGVSIDKISHWMGNTPEVCRRHYTQFILRDRHDSEIDKI